MDTHNESTLGGRLPLLAPSDLSASQKKLYDHLMSEYVVWATRSNFRAATNGGKLLGPFNAMLYSPEIGKAAMGYLSAERKNTSLGPRVREIVILTVGATWNAAYELYAHSAVANAAGLDGATIASIKARRAPEGVSDEEAIAYAFTRELSAEHYVVAPTYERAVKAFGETGVVEMIHLIGLYVMTCAMLNAFEVPVPHGAVGP